MSDTWRFFAESRILAAPLVCDEAVYFGTQAGVLFAVSMTGHEELWRIETGGKIDSTPVLRNGVIYCGNHAGSCFAVDDATGVIRWEFAAGSQISESPVIFGDTIIFGTWAGALHALDLENGQERWRLDTGGRISHSPAAYGDLIFFHDRRTVDAIQGKDGAHRWRAEGINPRSRLVAEGGLVVLGAGVEMVALDAATGKKIWAFDMLQPVKSPPLVAEGIVCGGSGNYLYGLELGTGLKRWELATGSAPKGASVCDGTVFFSTWNRDVFAVDLMTGRQWWTFSLETDPITQPGINDGWMMIGTAGGDLYGFALQPAVDDGYLAAEQAEGAEAGSVTGETGMTGVTGTAGVAMPRPYEPVAPPYSSAQEPWRAFVLLFLVGLPFELFWFYRNWKYMKRVEGKKILPGLRTLGLLVPILNLYLMYDQIRMVRLTAEEAGVRSYRLLPVITGWLTLANLPYTLPQVWSYIRPEPGKFDDLFLLVTGLSANIGSILILLIVQRTVNRIWMKRFPQLRIRPSFSGWQKTLIAIFGFFAVIGLVYIILTVTSTLIN